MEILYDSDFQIRFDTDASCGNDCNNVDDCDDGPYGHDCDPDYWMD